MEAPKHVFTDISGRKINSDIDDEIVVFTAASRCAHLWCAGAYAYACACACACVCACTCMLVPRRVCARVRVCSCVPLV